MNLSSYIKKNVKWTKQNSLRFNLEGEVVYIDPYAIEKETKDADFILITHAHHDHSQPESISKVINPSTVIIAPKSMGNDLNDYSDYMIMFVEPGDTVDLEDFSIEAVRAYNIKKTQCHPIENNWLGYIISTEDYSFYVTGDTEYIPEMEELEVDAIFLPMGQTYTFDSVEDAMKATVNTYAKVAVPVHYGEFEGSIEDVKKFSQMCLENSVEVVLL